MSAFRKQNSAHEFDRVPSYYANNKLYPKAYARNEFQGRTSRRIHDGLALPTNYGLDTVSDDVNSSPYSSPYFINGRFSTQNTSIQRGNCASVQGIERLMSVGDIEDDFEEGDIQTTLEMWQGKQIKFDIPYNGKVVGNTLTIKNTDGCTGILSIYISVNDESQPIYETAVDLCDISMDKFDHVKLYSATTIARQANPRGKLHVRMEIWNEVADERSANPFNTGRKIEIAATGNGNHYSCVYELGDKNVPVDEEYNYEFFPSRPLMGLIYNSYESIPVSRHEDQDNGAVVSLNGYKYGIFAYRTENNARLVIYDYTMNKLVEMDDKPVEYPVDSRAKEVNLVQAFDEVFYVDGYSVLKKFKIGEWDSLYQFPASKYEDVIAHVDKAKFAASDLGADGGDYMFVYVARGNKWQYEGRDVNLADYGITYEGALPADSGVITVTYVAAGQTVEASADATYSDARPVIAPSIICKHNNRIYLGGFLNDPNLVQLSEIVAEGPDYSSYPYRFYVPDNSPLATSTNTVTAMVTYTSDTIMIASKKSFSIFASNADFEGYTSKAQPSQVATYLESGGVESSGDIVNYNGIIYSFDPDEGIRRFTGSTWSKVPAAVDTLFDRVDMDKPRKLWGYASRLYFNYTDKIDGKLKCLIWDMEMNYQQYPWFQDVDIPFCDVRYDNDFDIVGIHSDYPCIMKLYAENCWRRLDSPITFERHTKYLSIPGNAHTAIVNRVHNKVLANANRWWYFSLAFDSDTLLQERGKESWYRFPCWDTKAVDKPVENPFTYQDVYESDAVAQLTISHIRVRGISVQEKVKVKTFREQASLISILFESRTRQLN